MVEFKVTCKCCDAKFDLRSHEIDGLADHIDQLENNAFHDGKDEGRDETTSRFAGYFDPDDLTSGHRPLWELAAAIRRGDIAEAEHQLDRVAEEIGLKAIEQVQQGRFSLRAKAA